MLCKNVIAGFLKRKKINNIFYLPGIHTVSLNASFIEHNMNVYTGRHESDLIYMADAYSRRTDKVGVIFVTPGPGLGNVVSGCMEAYGDNIPLIIFHVDTKREEHGRGILHELKEPENIFKNITKKTFYISDIKEVLSTLDAAYNEATSNRKGPVLISIPFSLLDKELPDSLISNEEEKAAPKEDITYDSVMENLEKILSDKKLPVIIGGKSLMFEEAKPVINSICSCSSIPFLTTTGGKGIIDERHPYAFGNIIKKGLINSMIKEADIVLAIGTRLRDVDAKRRGVKIKKLIHFDIDELWFRKNYETAFATSGNLLEILKSIEVVLKNRRFQWDIHSLKKKQLEEEKTIEKNALGYRIIKTIRDSIPDETVTVWDLNLVSYWAEYYFPVYEQRTFFMPRGISPIFYGLPAAIGVKIGSFETPCLTVCGDGGILPTTGELSLIKKHKLPVVILVYNNNSYGILEDVLERRYNLKNTATLINPDFVKLAHAFDIKAKRTKTIEGLRKIFLRDITWDEPFLIEFNYPIFTPPWDLNL